ncbi:hypothetical protein ACH35V_21460 [Actinomadura sp. 1N219]|uniref:hypothetical protein n=1 Tax=Actinomadura sp. 1N219 TaxID=3375152 RepID=UPI003791B9FE
MTMRRMVMAAGGAVLPVAVISVVFGNQWVAEALRNEAGPAYGGIWQPVYWLQTLRWFLYADNGMSWGVVIAVDFGVILSLALLAALVAVGIRAVDPNRGALGAVITGWWACVVAAGVGGFITGLFVELVIDSAEFHKIGGYVADGTSFGLLYGWTAGLGALAGHHLTRDRGLGGRQPVQQPFAQQQYGQQP